MEQPHPALSKIISLANVSRETVDKLVIYHDALVKWQKRINLVSPTTIDDAWERHFIDSAQLFNLLSDSDKPIFDLGSGAGFPGLVLSILGTPNISLLESDQRKCVFLSEVIRATGSNAKVVNGRIESVKIGLAHTITSRACASLEQLLSYSAPLLEPDGQCLFLKGRGAAQEIEEASKSWLFHVEQFPSVVDKEGCILRLSNIKKI